MNFLLLHRDEVDDRGIARLQGRRAEHVRTVLRATVGQQLRAGIVDGPLGRATVLAMAADSITVATDCAEQPPPTADVLLLAVPRPKVLLRMLAHAAALGFARIVLFRSWRVDKAHLQSTAMAPDAQRAQLLLGLEQAGRTRVPTVQSFPLFRPMVEDALPALGLPALRCVGHPTAATATHELRLARGAPFALLLGPDGGLIPYEVAALTAAGFLPIASGPHPLRTETALAVLWGQLDLLRRRGSLRP
ncbi:MAG: 16S rRNA (uracil(1498)-N(3))-methyltransferase [Planctomycetes bacterium]|nr:16S rRNA (uracil(1498)-N(3))-methyltransferase [Planctomycetota bacterium]